MPSEHMRYRWRLERLCLTLALYGLVCMGGAASPRWISKFDGGQFLWIVSWMLALTGLCMVTGRGSSGFWTRLGGCALIGIGHQVASFAAMILLLVSWPRLLTDFDTLQRISLFFGSLPFAVLAMRYSRLFVSPARPKVIGVAERSTQAGGGSGPAGSAISSARRAAW